MSKGRIACAKDAYDAVVVGSGPNGFAAAITLARNGRSVLMVEAAPTVGGGMRSAELTLPGFVHDVCSAVHPLGVCSPFFRSIPLGDYGLEWVHPDAPLAHPFDDGSAAVLEKSLEATARGLGDDGAAWDELFRPLAEHADDLFEQLLGPLRFPKHPLLLAGFGLKAMRSARGLAESRFGGERAKALFAGVAAHSILPLEAPLTAAMGLVLGLTAHAAGWPVARGGSGQIAKALDAYFRSWGGEIVTGSPVENIDDLPRFKTVFFDLGPRQLLAIAGPRFTPLYRRALRRYRYGPGAFKLDWALAGPIPWKSKSCARAATVHLGATLEEICASERAATDGLPCDKPFVLVAQQSLFDASRAPAGRQTGWGYCHVPHGSAGDATERIEAQVERFAPGFRDLILARHVMSPAKFQQYNANYVGGDINGGAQDAFQLFTRPALRRVPYSTPAKDVYICSSSTPPGGGVHGMAGLWAARAAMKKGL